jgi:outer membrane cobalamin receptor
MPKLQAQSLALVSALFLTTTAHAEDPKSIDEMSLEELMNVKVTVATKTASTLRESPGVISVVTREEIQALGARDLIDVLRTVPGFDFGLDGWAPTGPSIRGLWGSEGRILLLWDGIEMNELSAGGVYIGNRYPVDQIKRIEIIRGPGSVMYGGNAEVAVISITSLQAEDLNGPAAGLTYGRGTSETMRRHGHLLFGKAWESAKFSVAGFVGDGQRTDQDDFQAGNGSRLSHRGNWDLKPLFINTGLTVGNLDARLLWDRYSMTEAVSWGETTHYPHQKNRFENIAGSVKYTIRPTSGWTLVPFVSHQTQKPWWVDANPFYASSNKHTRYKRSKAGIHSTWDIASQWNLTGGLEASRDSGIINAGEGTFYTGGQEISFRNYAVYAQAQYSGFITANVGGRAEKHSNYASFFVPRVSVTKVFDPWHVKLLYAKAFRSPGVSNIHLGVVPSRIRPEKTQTAEIEVGRQLGQGLLTANVFNTSIDEPLVYLGSLDKYENQSRTGSWGAEMEYKLRPSWGFLNTGLSYYRSQNSTDVYEAPSHDEYALAAPAFKGTVTAKWKVAQDWAIGPSLIYLAKRYGYDWLPDQGATGYRFFDPAWLLNLSAEYTHDAWTASLAVLDILNQNPHFLQPYRGSMTSVPGPSREILLKVRYGF